MAAGLEITDVRRLEVAHCETALLPRVAGFWLVRVLPSMVQEEEHIGDKERPCYDEEHHAPGALRLNSDVKLYVLYMNPQLTCSIVGMWSHWSWYYIVWLFANIDES